MTALGVAAFMLVTLPGTTVAAWATPRGQRVEASLRAEGHPSRGALEKTETVLEHRLAALGVKGATVGFRGDIIAVSLPSAADDVHLISVVSQMGLLLFRPVECEIEPYASAKPVVRPMAGATTSGPARSGPPGLARSICGLSPAAQGHFLPAHADRDGATPALYDDADSTVVLPYYADLGGGKYRPDQRYVLGPAQMSGTIVASAAANLDQQTGQWEIDLALTAKGSNQFNEYAAVYYACYERDPTSPPDAIDCPPYGDRQALEVDGVVEAAPVIEAAAFGPAATIAGGTPPFTAQQARELADLLSYGPLPERLVLEEISTVTPVAK